MALQLVFDVNDKATPQISKLQKQLNTLQKQVNSSKNTFLGFDKSLVATAGAFISLSKAIDLTQSFVKSADTISLLDSRLSLVTESTEELTKAQTELFKISQDARTGLENTFDLYTRLARSTKDLSINQDELLQITETINKTITISGTTAATASASLFQLGQGLGAGALRGEELNSVLEGTPRLARAIADGLGVTISQLRTLGSEGKLSAEVVTGALQSQSKVVEEEFKKINRTVGQSFVQVGNSTTALVGKVDKVLGVTASFSESIGDLSSTIDNITTEEITNLIEGIETTSKVFLSVGIGIASAKTALVAYNITTGFLVSGTTKATTSMSLFGNTITKTSLATTGLSTAMKTIPFVAIASGITALSIALFSADDGAKELQQSYEEMSKSLEGLTVNQLKYKQSLIETELIQKRLELANAKADVGSTGLFESDEELLADRARLDVVRTEFRDLQKLSVDVKRAINDIGSSDNEGGVTGITDKDTERAKKLKEEMASLLAIINEDKGASKALEKELQDRQNFIESLGNLGKSQAQLEKQRLVEQFELNKQFIDKSSQEYANYAEELKRLDAEILQSNIEANREKTLSNGSFIEGAVIGQQQLEESSKTTAELGRDAYVSFANNSADALARFVTGGKVSFSDFAKSLIADLARIAAQQAITGLFGSIVGAFAGGVGASPSSNLISGTGASGGVLAYNGGLIPEYANGGVVTNFANGGYTGNGGKFEPKGIVHGGEYVFTKQETNQIGVDNLRSIAKGNFGRGTSSTVSSPNIIININESSQSTANVQTRQNEQGDIDVQIDIIEKTIAGRITQGTSEIGASMEGNFGLSRGRG